MKPRYHPPGGVEKRGDRWVRGAGDRWGMGASVHLHYLLLYLRPIPQQ